jgi:hypothetical protein
MNIIGTTLTSATYSNKDFSKQTSKGFFLLLDYEKVTNKSVATYIPMEYYQQVQDIYSHYHPKKDHAFQFTLNSMMANNESVEYMVKGISYMQTQRIEFVQCLGELQLPSEFQNPTVNTDTTEAMMTLLSKGGIARYFEHVVRGPRLAELHF